MKKKSQFRAFVKKEFTHILRDKRTMMILFITPIVLILLFSYAISTEIRNVNVVAVIPDNDSDALQLVREIDAGEMFDVIMHIPSGMEKDVANGENVEIFIAANAVNSTKGMMGSGYLSSIVSGFSASLSGGTLSAPVNVSVQNMYNRHQNYRLFMVPAFLIMILIAICSFLPTLNIVSEKEKGTIEQINVTPVTKAEFILSKIIFYGLLGLSIFTIAFFAGKAVYGIAPYGGYGTLYFAAVLFILFMAGFGLTISNFSNTLQQAVFMMFFFMMIFVLMSGLFTPVRSMVRWAYDITFLLASRYFVDIMRAVCLKGATLADLSFEFGMLGLYTLMIDLIAIVTYRKSA